MRPNLSSWDGFFDYPVHSLPLYDCPHFVVHLSPFSFRHVVSSCGFSSLVCLDMCSTVFWSLPSIGDFSLTGEHCTLYGVLCSQLIRGTTQRPALLNNTTSALKWKFNFPKIITMTYSHIWNWLWCVKSVMVVFDRILSFFAEFCSENGGVMYVMLDYCPRIVFWISSFYFWRFRCQSRADRTSGPHFYKKDASSVET